MKCDKVRERMSDYREGILTPEEESLVRRHLASCINCGAAYSDLQKTIGHIKSLGEVEPPSWLTQKVMARVREEAPKKGIWKRLFYPLHIKVPLEAAATVLIAVTALYIFKATEHETKISEVTPGRIEGQQSQTEDALRKKSAKKVETEKKSVPIITEEKAKPGKAVPSMPFGPEQRPGRDNFSPVITQKESAGKNLPQTPPAPALQMEKKDVSGGERLTESGAADKQKATGSMKYAAPLEKEELMQSPASAAPAGKMGKAVSEEGRISKKTVTLHLHVTNIDQANDAIRVDLAVLGGRLVGTEAVRDKRILTIEIGSKNIKVLLEKLKAVGELREKEPPSGITEGTVKVKIEMSKTPDY